MAFARSVLGIGEATYGVIAPTILLDLFAREQRARLMSAYYLALEIKQVHEGMMIALPADEWTLFRTMTVAEFAAQLKAMASHMDLDLYRKSKRGPKKPPPPKDPYKNGGHVSTHKELTDKKP